MNENSLEYGMCVGCGRLMPLKHLEQIRYYEGHKRRGAHHHKLLCGSCKVSADEIFQEK